VGASSFSTVKLQQYVDALVADGRVPALSMAIWHQGQTHRAAAGVLNITTGERASPDTLFMIGSISKVLTASLIMRLVDEGRLDLDVPVNHYLRDFHVADAQAVRRITARHLLSHTSGLETDIYPEDSWEEGNPIARYVDRCFLLPQVHRDFGCKYSYSNVGYVLAGRLAEVVTGMPWAQAIEEYIFKPLGMERSSASPLQILRHSAAAGHMYSFADKQWHLAPHAYCPRGNAPAGSAISMSAEDLLKFARAHLERGRSVTGKEWLSEDSVRTMQKAHVQLPASTSLFETAWGVGWSLTELGGINAYGHGGGRVGYQALLEIVPERSFVLAMLANGMTLGGAALARQVLTDVLKEMMGVEIVQVPPTFEPRTLACYTGRYGAAGFKFDVKDADDHLAVEFALEGLATEHVHFTLRPTANDRFAVYSPAGEYWEGEVAFLEPDEYGVPQYFFFANRLNVRVTK
jgi:CubicO group peptidase (beta-lactamase class C family)